MSTAPDNEFDLDKLFLPAWAQEDPAASKYSKYEGETERPDRRGDRRGPRPPRRDGPPSGRSRGDRPRTDRRGPGGPDRRAEPGSGPGGPERRFRRERPGGLRGEHRGPRERREPPAPLPEVNLTLVPEDKGVEFLARQIKMTGRAYPLFDIAQMILQKPERYLAAFEVKKNAEGKPIQPLFVCALDETLWLSEEEAISHVLRKHFNTFYQADRTATEPPKGKYTFVAQCGMSGVVLGPPNYHDYQNQLRKLHAERFSRMPFEVYKSRVKIVRDEAVVKKWVEDQSWKTEYVCLNMPEAVRLPSMEAVEKHFRENHKDNIIKPVEKQSMTGLAARNLRSLDLTRLARTVWEDQRRFPLQIATVLSQQFASHGLQFFKVNKTITHVCVARPHYLDLSLTPVSEGVKRIVDYINGNPKCSRRQLVESIAPTPAPTVLPVNPEPAAPSAEAPAAVAAQPAGPTPEQTAVIADLHWLIHQGHVIEFANGSLETAKKPVPKPPKPAPVEATPAQPEAAAVAPATPVPSEAAPVASEGNAVSITRPEEAPSAPPQDAPKEINAPEFVRPADEAEMPPMSAPAPNTSAGEAVAAESDARKSEPAPAPVESPS